MAPDRRLFLAAAASAPFLRTARAAARRPNVVVLMTDDHGAWATGAYGCPAVRTPHIDRLAASGARFTSAFACTPVCSPSRLTYMTGLIPSRHGVQDWLIPRDSFGPQSRRWLDGHRTWSEVLAHAGYTLGMCGKWHMGHDDTAQAGFSYWATVPGGGGPYRDCAFVHNGVTRKVPGFKTDVQTDFALDFLDRHHQRQPFALFVPFYAPHTPYDDQPERDRRPYLDAALPCFPDTPPHPWQVKGLARHHGNRDSQRAYAALVSGVDHNVGRLLDRLERLRLRENTLVVFTADQGWSAGHHGVWGKGNGTVPFNMYEEAIRVPLLWSHPRGIRRGVAVDALVSNYDFFDTLLDYLGIQPPEDAHRAGRSYAPFLRGRRPEWRDRLYFEYAYVRSVRTRGLKYVQRAAPYPSELFDLQADPGETRDVSADPAYTKPRDALRADLEEFFRGSGAPPIAGWRGTTRQALSWEPPGA